VTFKTKFDFTSVSGAKKAFEAAFPKSPSIRSVFDEPLLAELEATRNVIVHRAGLMDETFARRTGAAHVNAPLSVDTTAIERLASSVCDGGIRLLREVDNSLRGLS
jgi:hypothetical protein